MDTVLLSTFKMLTELLTILGLWKTNILTRTPVIKLFKTSTPITDTTLLSALTECDFSGYAPSAVATINGPAIDQTGNAYLTAALAYFANDGGGTGNQVFSAALVAEIPGSTQATGTVTTTAGVVSAPVITLAGAGYVTAPKVTVLGGGTGAVITATIAGGVVTALNLVSGGTGYTAATIVIDPPYEIIAAQNLASPVPMNVATDALPLVLQLNMAS